MLTLTLFGAPSLTSDGPPLAGRAAHGRRLALLALLTCARGRALRRDRILALLWPETPTDRARAQLSDDIYILRSGLGEDVVLTGSDEVALNADAIDSDVASFERLLDEGQHEQAVALVTGPFLDGFHLAGSPEFERWLDAERLRLAARCATALESLAENAEAAADFGAASAWWRRLAAHDPFSGRVSLRLMRALDANGDRAGAIRHAQMHTTILREELDAAPTPEVVEFAERLRVEPPTHHAAEPVTASVAAASVSAAAGAAGDDALHQPQEGKSMMHAAASRPSTFRYATAAIALLALAIFGFNALTGPRPAAPTPAPSIGVLPFVNVSADPENAWFSDGLTEQIIATLGRVEGLHVAASTSSFRLRNLELDVRAIGDTLGVATVLEGSVRRDGARLRVTAQLIDAATGYHLWADEYDRRPEDAIDVQVEIASAIAHALRLRLAPIAHAPAPDLEAYDLYLRALYLRNTLKEDELAQAIDFFDRAIARAPTFALAYAGKASVVAPSILFGYRPAAEGMPELRALIDRALQLDPTLGEAHTVRGIVRLWWDWDWAGAERSIRRAVELNPSDAHAHHHLANYFNVMAMTEDARAARARSVELDPLNARTLTNLASDHLRLGNHDVAMELYRRVEKLDPVHPLILGSGPWLPGGVANVYEAQGRHREAVVEYLRIATLRGATRAEVDALHDAFAHGGMPAFWRVWLDMDRRQMPDLQDPIRSAKLWLLAGDTAQALDLLDRAYEQRHPALVMLGRGLPSSFDGMMSHPRVSRIIAAMKLPRS